MRSASIKKQSWLTMWLLAIGGLLPAASARGEEIGYPSPTAPKQSTEKLSETSVELFEALSDNKVEVRFIPQSAARAVVQIKNVSQAPLELELPAAFGAVHVLAQVGLGGLGAGGLNAGGLNAGGLAGQAGGQGGLGLGGGGQGLGGGFGGGLGGGAGLNGAALNGGGLGGGGFNVGGGGLFRIEAGKTRKLAVPTVCLEHGKPDPNPRMTYQIVPLEQVNGDPALTQLCRMLGQGTVPQSVAQAAAWHLANDLTWEELRLKDRHQSRYTGNTRWFSSAEIESAWQLVQRCRNADWDRLSHRQSSGE